VRPDAYRFGRGLKDQREGRGVTLEAIAARTKINRPLLAALERGDLSAWPGGIFRRAFVREYAAAIGAAPGPILAELARLFPEPGSTVAAEAPQPASELRLTLARDGRTTTIGALNRVAIALVEVGLIVAASLAIASAGGSDAWRICATVALIYYPMAMAVEERSGALWFLHRIRAGAKPAPAAATEAHQALYAVMRPSPDVPGESAEGLA
jgi:transcriptional regulator with XRE-family HTH domain